MYKELGSKAMLLELHKCFLLATIRRLNEVEHANYAICVNKGCQANLAKLCITSHGRTMLVDGNYSMLCLFLEIFNTSQSFIGLNDSD